MIILAVISVVTVWTVSSIWYAFCHLGDKNKPDLDPWYIWVLGAPVLAIACLIGTVRWLIEKIRG